MPTTFGTTVRFKLGFVAAGASIVFVSVERAALTAKARTNADTGNADSRGLRRLLFTTAIVADRTDHRLAVLDVPLATVDNWRRTGERRHPYPIWVNRDSSQGVCRTSQA